MAFGSMLRRSAAAAIPLATRFVGRSRLHTSTATLFSAVRHSGAASSRQHLCRNSFPSILRFSTEVAKSPASDEKLLRIIESEINGADDEQDADADVPDGFPFKIEDNPGEQIVKLTRQYEGETIEVEVYMPDLVTGDDNEHDDNDDSESSPQSHLPLLVKISKDGGPSLEFSCTANADEVNIDSLSVKEPETSDEMAYDGPAFGDLDENLQKAFHKYLNIRGVTPFATNFLHEYMINKDGREYKNWLNNLKKFVEA